ncbi:MAG: prolyl-tRNA synthetase associated domain-containing protein, partial [Clostridia bacterium]|nr:prolyl-tRNA synthetase associated domain-containing protein [Clostridia bacterium]
CYDLLDSLGVSYERIDHERADTMEACAAVDEALGAAICKNLFLCNRQQTAFYLLMIPADKPFKTKDLSDQIGSSRLSFASAEHMERLLDISPGSVSVMGLMNDVDNAVTLLVDEELLSSEYIGCHPCVNTASLKLKTADVFGVILDAMHHAMKTVSLPRDIVEE